jgi:hypothetical protein
MFGGKRSVMTIEISFWSASFIVAAWAALQFLVAEWMKARLLKSIEHEYQKKLEEYRYDLKVREQAARVAEYLSLRNSDKNDVYLMNKLSWELALWLPAEVYQKLAHVIVNAPDAQKYKELLIDVRKLLLKDNSDKLTWDNIIHTNWPNQPVEGTRAERPRPSP